MLIQKPLQLQEPDISPAFVKSTAKESRVLQRVLKHAETPEAIREFARIRSQLGDYAYWFTLASLWVSYTGHSELKLWKRLFAAQRLNRDISLMKPSEYLALLSLPDEFIIYRPHRPDEVDWIAYTLNPQIAARFAFQRGVSEVHAYAIARNDVLALFLRRGEEEVLVLEKERARLVRVLDVVIERKGEESDDKRA